MSTEYKAIYGGPTRWVKPKTNVDNIGDAKPPVVEKIDIDSLQIDESYELDCDPYNSTGQHLIDTLKKRYEE